MTSWPAALTLVRHGESLGNVANDFWLEQVVKRGWTSWEIPSVLQPRATWAWAVLLAGTALVLAAWYGRDAPDPARD